MIKKSSPHAVSLRGISIGSRRRKAVSTAGRNLKLTIEYDGRAYRGWQIQKGRHARTIQQTIEQVLARILNEKVRLIGSGRTDAGVHALGQVANFKTKKQIAPGKLKRALNGLLPADIVVQAIKEVPLDFHSRFSARTKLYRYTILQRDYRCAHLNNLVYFYPYPLALELMKKAARSLLGKRDFSCFQSRDRLSRNPWRTIKKLKITKKNSFIYIDIEADGFLSKMCRNIVGTLLEVGRGRAITMSRLLLSRDRTIAGPTAPAAGLCLVRVKY